MVLFASPLGAQESERLSAETVQLFNQYLYFGSFSRPRSIAFDREHGEVWVADTNPARIGVFRPDGAELHSFASKEYVRDPSRIVLAPGGRVAILEGDRAHVRLFNYRGMYTGDLELAEIGEKPVIGALAWDSEGQLYVAENRAAQIFVYRADGSLKFRFGSRGTDEGQFESITAIAIGSDGTIFVADQQALAIQLFDSQGNFVRGWGRHEMGASNVSLPSGIALDSKERILLSDELRHQVKVFDQQGNLLASFGGLGNGKGQLSFPTDLAVDAQDRVYVTERLTARVQVFQLVEPATR